MSLEQGLAHFGFTTLNYLPANETLIFSPLSIILALGVISAGLDGYTKLEFDKAFSKATSSSLELPFTLPRFDSLEEECSESLQDNSSFHCFKPLFPKPKNTGSPLSFYTFLLSNILLKNQFISDIYERYEADTIALNLRDVNGTLNILNEKIDKLTGGKFKLPKDIIDPTSAANLVNFVHFKGDWQHRFSHYGKEKFYLGNGQHKELPFMTVTDYFKYSKMDEFKLISMDYLGGFKFIAILPNENLSLEDCLKNLSLKELLKLIRSIDNIPKRRIYIQMPKFKIVTEIDLKAMLREFGIFDIFSLSGNFSRMTDEQICISKGRHSTMIDLDEKGTKAVGITSFQYVQIRYIPQPDPLVIKLDRPFAFFITVNNNILFMGKMNG